MMANSMRENNEITIREMTLRDLTDVVDAEKTCFPKDAWSEQSFIESLEFDNSFNLVAYINDRLIGYLISFDVLDEGHLLNIAVLPDERRKATGEKIMMFWLNEGIRKGWSFAFLEVRESNRSAIRLYERLGFLEVGSRKGYYSNGEDAILMTLTLEAD